MHWFWQSKPTPPPPDYDDELSHDVRNAILGLQHERKQIVRSLVNMGQHLERIELALNRRCD